MDPSDFQTTADINLLKLAISEPKYKLSDSIRRNIISVLELRLADPLDPKMQLAAVNALLKADSLNLETIKVIAPKRHEIKQLPVKELTTEELQEKLKLALQQNPKLLEGIQCVNAG